MQHPAPDSTALAKKALLLVLIDGLVHLRNLGHDPKAVADGLIFDLADALHVVPNVIDHYGPGHDAEYLLKCFFRPFDKKWANRSGVLKLEATFQAAREGGNRPQLNPY